MDAVEFGAWMRQRAIDLRLSQSELARRAGVSTSLVAKLQGSRSSKSKPMRPTAIDLARALECDVDEVLGWLGYAPLTAEETRTAARSAVPSAAERLKAMLRVWCRLSRSEQDVLMEVAMLLGSRGAARPGMGVTIFDAGSGVSPTDPRCAVPGHG